MGESADDYRRVSAQRCLPGMDEPEEGEIIRESKRGRCSEHGNKENFTDSLECRHYSRDRLPQMHGTNHRHYSRDRLPQMHGTDSTDDEKHERHKRSSPCRNFSKGMFQRVSAVEYADRAASYNGGRLIKDDSGEMAYCRRDSDASFRQRDPHYRRQVEGYSSFPKCLPHDQPDCRPCDRKRSYDAGRDNFLDRNSPRSGDQTTFKEPHWSSRRKSNDDKFHIETSNSLSWNGPKWGEETTVKDASNSSTWMPDNSLPWNGPRWGEETIKDAPNSSKWRSDDLNHACDKEVGTSFPWSGPKWGEETNPKFAQIPRGDNQDYNGETNNGLPCTDSKQGDEAHTEDEPSSCRSTTTKWGSNETKISSSLDDGATAKDVPSSLHRKSDADKWGSNMKTDRKSSWHGPEWGDGLKWSKSAPNFSQWNGTDSTDDEKHERHKRSSPCHNFSKGMFQRVSAVEYADRAASYNGGRLIKDDSGEMAYCRRDSDASFRQREPHYRRQVEGYSSFPKCLPHDQPDCRPCDRKRSYDAGRDNFLSRNGPRSGDRTTFKEPHWSSRRKSNDDKFHMETSNSLSWNGPKWGEETTVEDASNSSTWMSDYSLPWNGPKWGKETIKDAPNSSKWASDDLNHACDREAGTSFPWSGPKWVEETNPKFAQIPRSDNQDYNGETNNDLPCTDSKQGDEAHTEDGPSLWRSTTTKWGSNETKISSSWDDGATAKDVPSSLHQKSDADKCGSNVKTDRKSSWHGPEWGDGPKWSKPAPNSSQWKSVADNQGYNGGTDNDLSCTDSKRDDEVRTKDEPSSWRSTTTKWGSKETKNSSSWNDEGTSKDVPSPLQWRSDTDKCGSDVKTGRKSSWHGPKWSDETDIKGTQSSRRSSNTQRTSKETNSSFSCGPKWGGESTTKDAPSSYQRRSDANTWGSSVKTDRKSSWHGPKWGADVKTNNSLSWHGPKWVDEPNTKDAPSSWRSLAEWGSKEPNDSSSLTGQKWDDKATKDAPGSPKRKLDADKWGSNVKLDDLSWKGPKWGDKQTEDASNSSGWKANANREVSNVETKWGYQTTTKSMPNSSRCRLDDDKQSNNVETQKSSWNGPKWDDHGTIKDAPKSSRWGSDGEKRDNSVKTGDCSLLDSLKLGERSNTKDFPNSSQHQSDGDRKHYNVESNNRPDAVQGAYKIEICNKSSWSGQKWYDQTTMKDAHSFKRKSDDAKNHCFDETENSSLLNNPTWGDEITTKDAGSSRCKLDTDPQVPNMEANNSMLCNGPKRGGQSATKDAPFTSGCSPKQVYNEESKKTSWNDSQRDDLIAPKDASEPFRHSSNDGKREYHLNNGNSFSLDAPNVGVQIITYVSPNFSQQSSDNKMDHGVKADNLSQNRLDCGDQTITQEAYKRAFPSDDQNITCETSGKDQHVLKILLSPSSIFNLSEQKGLEGQSLNNGEQSQFTSRHEALNQKMEHSISTNGQDTMSKLPSNGQGLKSDWHGHPVGSSKLSQLPTNLKSFANVASAATATVHIQPCLGYPSTEPITIDSSHLKDSAIQTKSQAAPKSLVSPSGAKGPSTDGDMNLSTNLDGGLHHRKQGPKQVELIQDTVIETIKTKTGQSKEEETTSHPNLADCNMRNAVEINKDDEKGIRMFKFAIAEFVKDIIKPYWKEGHLTKEAHKTIVKKVVDKVIGTMQATGIPQTQKNIDLYISYAKLRLTNLVWAYLAKYAKS